MYATEALVVVLAWLLHKTWAQNAGWRTLLTMSQDSPFTVTEIWEMNSQVSEYTYTRSVRIDNLNVTKPKKISLEVKDKHWRTMATIVFGSSGIFRDIESLLLTYPNMKTHRLNKLEPFDAYLDDNRIELREPGFLDGMVYFATGRYNKTDSLQFIGIPKMKSTFSISEGMDLREGSQRFWSSYYENTNGVQNASILVSGLDNRNIYINGISILDLDDATTYFTIGVNKDIDSQCDITNIKNLAHKYSFKCNGNLHNLDSSIKTNCLWIFFGTTVYKYNISLWESDKQFVLGSWIQLVGYYEDTPTSSPIINAVTSHLRTDGTSPGNSLSAIVNTTSAMSALLSSTTATPDCKSYCNCSGKANIYGVSNKTKDEIDDEIQKISNELRIDRRTLSSSVRRKSSAADGRLSSAGMGVLGITILVLELCMLLAADLIKLKTIIGQSYLVNYFAQGDQSQN